MATWEKIDPHLKLERLQVRNFRNIKNLDITIPENKKIICLVGPNGGSKSALLSLVIHTLRELTRETVPDLSKELSSSSSSISRIFSTSEIGTAGEGYVFTTRWKSIAGIHQYKLLVAIPTFRHNDFISKLREDFDAPDYYDDWLSREWENRPTANHDPVAKSVFLFRPSGRFETPFYEEVNQEISFGPRIATNWEGRRLYPVKSTSSLAELESIILDLFLDQYLGHKSAGLAINKLLETMNSFRNSVEEKLQIPPGPFRRVRLGSIEALSLLSAGELDIFVTVGNIISQQIYLSNKFDPTGDNEVMPSGWVFIDEVDAHLHPQWQQQVLPTFANLFPNIHFMITTHSPFVLRSLPKEESLVIRLPDGEVFDTDFSAWPIDDILAVVFNVPSHWSAEIEEQLKLLQNQLLDPSQTEPAIELYFKLVKRSSRLRAACDRIVALYGSPAIRDRITQINLNIENHIDAENQVEA